MRDVSRFEAELLRILRCLLQRAPAEQVVDLVLNRTERPGCVSRNCVDLAIDSLRKGCVSLLARIGGWQRQRFLRGDRPASGRTWERTDPKELGLAFSRHSLSFLLWLRASDPRTATFRPRTEKTELALGDQYLFFLAYQALRDTEAGPALLRQPVIARSALVRLAWPEDFHDQPATPVDAGPWLTPQALVLLEMLQPWLHQRWKGVERHKRVVIHAREMTGIGRAQDQVLDSFLEGFERLRRRDLSRFLVQALADVVAGTPEARDWIRSLRVEELRAADRAAAYAAAMALLRRGQRFETWTAEARGVSYLDREDYAAAQLWLSDWDRLNGDAACRTAHDLVRALDPLRVASV